MKTVRENLASIQRRFRDELLAQNSGLSMETQGLPTPENLIFNEIQVLPAEQFRSIFDCRS